MYKLHVHNKIIFIEHNSLWKIIHIKQTILIFYGNNFVDPMKRSVNVHNNIFERNQKMFIV